MTKKWYPPLYALYSTLEVFHLGRIQCLAEALYSGKHYELHVLHKFSAECMELKGLQRSIHILSNCISTVSGGSDRWMIISDSWPSHSWRLHCEVARLTGGPIQWELWKMLFDCMESVVTRPPLS